MYDHDGTLETIPYLGEDTDLPMGVVQAEHAARVAAALAQDAHHRALRAITEPVS